MWSWLSGADRDVVQGADPCGSCSLPPGIVACQRAAADGQPAIGGSSRRPRPNTGPETAGQTRPRPVSFLPRHTSAALAEVAGSNHAAGKCHALVADVGALSGTSGNHAADLPMALSTKRTAPAGSVLVGCRSQQAFDVAVNGRIFTTGGKLDLRLQRPRQADRELVIAFGLE